jgi:hypothetical protein
MVPLAVSTPKLIATLFNIVNSSYTFIPFQIFTFNPLLTAALFGMLILMCVLFSLYNAQKLKRIGWHLLLQQQRDLL